MAKTDFCMSRHAFLHSSASSPYAVRVFFALTVSLKPPEFPITRLSGFSFTNCTFHSLRPVLQIATGYVLMLIPEGNIAVLIPLNPQNNTLKTRQLTCKKQGLHIYLR